MKFLTKNTVLDNSMVVYLSKTIYIFVGDADAAKVHIWDTPR